MSEQREVSYSESLVHPPANLNFVVWLILLGVPALLLFLIGGKDYEARVLDRPALGSPVSEPGH